MKKLLAFLFLFPVCAHAADSAWVQATATGYEARLVTSQASCPVLHTPKGDAPMTVRAPANANFPLVCVAPIPAGTASATVAGISLPVPVADPQRILVLGDTGCRIKGAALQACNDPAQWPFPQLAAAAAGLKPDLIIHVGDYLYRESACPVGNAGCAGSPWGDNWITWQADFYAPPRHCWRRRPSCWCAAITKTAAAPVGGGNACKGLVSPSPARRMTRSIPWQPVR